MFWKYIMKLWMLVWIYRDIIAAECFLIFTCGREGTVLKVMTNRRTRARETVVLSFARPPDAIGNNAFSSVCLRGCVCNSLIKSFFLQKAVDWSTVLQQKQSSQTVAFLFISPFAFITVASRQQCAAQMNSNWYLCNTHTHTHTGRGGEREREWETSSSVMTWKDNNRLFTPPG